MVKSPWKKPTVSQQVLRYEGKSGSGVYKGEGYARIHGGDKTEDLDIVDLERHPFPPDNLPFSHRSGFATPAQAHAWFGKPHEQEALKKAGKSLTTYDVPIQHVIEGNKQLAFNRRFARKVK